MLSPPQRVSNQEPNEPLTTTPYEATSVAPYYDYDYDNNNNDNNYYYYHCYCYCYYYYYGCNYYYYDALLTNY